MDGLPAQGLSPIYPTRWAQQPGGQDENGIPRPSRLGLYETRTGRVRLPENALPPMEQNPQAQRIVQDRSLSREQKRRAIEALGYSDGV